MRHTGWPAVCFSWCNDKKHGPRPARPDVINILAIAPAPPDAPTLVADLESNGLLVCCRTQCANLVREAVRHAPDLVIVWEPHPGEDLFEAVRLLEASMPVPVLVFTSDVRAETMETALAAGIDGWVVNGYAAGRLRPLIQFTVARHRQMRQMREELGDLKRRFEERKLVDRAKGILMTARHVSEDEAFRLLRSASMHAKQRIGQVSQQVIDAAHYADAINRAGRLRMLSQRIVKLYARNRTVRIEPIQRRTQRLLASVRVVIRDRRHRLERSRHRQRDHVGERVELEPPGLRQQPAPQVRFRFLPRRLEVAPEHAVGRVPVNPGVRLHVVEG